MSNIDEWASEPDDVTAFTSAGPCVHKRINPETGEIETVSVTAPLNSSDKPGTTLAGLKSGRHANASE